MVKSLGVLGAVIEPDNQVAIKLSVSVLVPPWEVSYLVMDIRQLKQDSGVCLSWVKREANDLAHVVATKALRGLLPFNWLASSFVVYVLAIVSFFLLCRPVSKILSVKRKSGSHLRGLS